MRGFRQWRWHLDAVFVKINADTHQLRRAVDHEGEILESYVTKSRDEQAALAFMKKTLKRHGSLEAITTDDLRSYGAMRDLGNADRQEVGRHASKSQIISDVSLRQMQKIVGAVFAPLF